MTKVLIRRGDWSGQVIRDKTMHFVRGLSIGQKGPFILVDGTGVDGYPQRPFRVFVSNPSDFELEDKDVDIFAPRARQSFRGSPNELIRQFIGEGDIIEQVEASKTGPSVFSPERLAETEEQIRDRIQERFTILSQLSMDVARGNVKGLVVSGASGVGKSFEVEAALNRDSLLDKLSFNADAQDQDPRRVGKQGTFRARYNIIKGYSTAPALYTLLHEYSDSREVLVFDDCDSVLGDETSLNILKAALDTTSKRIIQWRSQSRNTTDAPNSFEFRGSVIFITNVNFERIVEKGTHRLAPHLEAIMSRCLYLDLTIDTVREKLVRIDHVVNDLKMLEKEFFLEPEEIKDVLEWTHQYANKFRELSLRKVGQLGSFRKSNPNWERIAQVTLLRR